MMISDKIDSKNENVQILLIWTEAYVCDARGEAEILDHLIYSKS